MTVDTVGGVWTYALELARGLAASGVSTALAVTGAPADRSQRADAAAIPGLFLDEGPFPLEWMPEVSADRLAAAGDWLLDLERRLQPDIVHVNGYAAAALPFRAPVVCVAHSCVLSWWRAVHGEDAPAACADYATRVRDGLRLADRLVAPTAAMLDSLRSLYGTALPGTVIHNGRDPLRFRPLPDKQPVVLGVGRLWDEGKNTGALDRVAPRLDWPVVLAGDARSPDGAHRPPGHARHVGRVPAATVAAWLGRAAVFAHPSRYEPFGLAPLEAAMSGCALVLGDLPSLRELWGGAALFVDPDDDRALTRALMRLIDDPGRRAGLAAAARRRARCYTADRMVRGYLGVYSALLHDRVEHLSSILGTPCASLSSPIRPFPAGTTATPIFSAESSGT